MAICYLCGETMIDRVYYEGNMNQFKEKPKLKHGEHIIQDALYGRLIADDILCETCGSKLSVDVDRNFVQIFQNLSERVSHILASKTKNRNYEKALKGYVIIDGGRKIDIVVKGGKISPTKPFYDYDAEKLTVKIYAAKETYKSYVKHVQRELLENGVSIDPQKFSMIDHIGNYEQLGIYFSEGIENFNVKFKLGLNKIATGFAAMNGVKREHLTTTLDKNGQNLIFTDNIVPFYPFSAIDCTVEPLRLVYEAEFPTHTLILYVDSSGESRKLVCYVDLFSTFQFYVILNHDYKGDNVHKVYYQTILRQEKPKIDVKRTRPKHLNILAEGLGVKLGEMAGLDIEGMYAFLEKKYQQMTVDYTLDLNEYWTRISNKMIIGTTLYRAGKKDDFSQLEQEILEIVSDVEMDDLIAINHEVSRIENYDIEKFYRQEFFTCDEEFNIYIVSHLYKMIELNNVNSDLFKSYGHAKFHQLQNFINRNSHS